MSKRLAGPLFLFLLLPLLLGADGCPISIGTGDPGGGGGGTSGAGTASVDVGGQSGATWQLQFEQEALVTVRLASGKVASKKAPLRAGALDLLGATVDVGNLCWRTDLVCPQSVLAEQTPIVQPSAGGVMIGFNHRGPLSTLRDEGLGGRLDGRQLAVPLAVGNAAEGFCALRNGSAILASAYATDGAKADSLEGRVIVVYDGLCASLGGAALPTDAVLELSVGFSGKRL